MVQFLKNEDTMENIKTCEICFCSFTPYRKTQKYCCDCKIVAAKNRKKEWYIKTKPNAYAPKKERRCVVCGEPFRSHFEGLPYCNKHYLKMKFYGTTEKISRNRNTVIDEGSHFSILTAKGMAIYIDKQDLDLVKKSSWCLDPRGYAVANIEGKTQLMHRVILGLKDSKITADHINGVKLDNRRSNLRMCRQGDNSKNISKKKTNTSGYPGIRKTPQGKYNVRITIDRKEIHIGNFDTFDEAVAKRKAAEIEHFGLYAPSLGTNAGL